MRGVVFAGMVLWTCGVVPQAQAHVFPERSEPRVGSTVKASPSAIRIWFDGLLEPAFSTIEVYSSSRERLDKGDGHVNSSDHTILEVNLPPLPPGTYHVVWGVVAMDGHRTEGDHSFTVTVSP